jgi:hypothetical protein
MELRDAILLLEYYNRWRRGEDESLDMPNPQDIGVALDTVLAAVTEGGTGNSGVERPEPSPHFQPERDEARQQEQIHYDNFLSMQKERDDTRRASALWKSASKIWRRYCANTYAKLCKLERERDEARSLAQAGYAKAERAEKMLRTAAAKADQWRECAEKLESFVYTPFAADEHAACAAALAEFKRLKEASK